MTALGVLAVLVLVILGALAWALHKHGRRHLKRRGGPRRGADQALYHRPPLGRDRALR